MDDIKEQIIVKLSRGRYWGNRLCNVSDLVKAVHKHKRKEAKRAIEDLYKQGFLKRKPGTKSEFRYSLALSRKREIETLLSNNYTFNV